MVSRTKTKRVVIIGGGFAGVAAFAAIKSQYAVTLVDPSPDFEFTPHIVELVSRVKTPKSLRIPRRRIAGKIDQSFVEDRAAAVDLRRRVVTTQRGDELHYDALVLAPGGAPAASSTPGVAEHALTCDRVDNAMAIERRLRVLAALGRDVHVTIAGGGFTGVELLGEILREYRDLERVKVRIVESSDRLMRSRPKVVDERLQKIAKKHRVEVRVSTRLARVGATEVVLDNGEELESDLTLWTVGRAAAPISLASGLIGPDARDVRVQATLQTLVYPEVFVAGDAAHLPQKAEKQAIIALQLGDHAGRNVNRFLAGKDTKQYRGQLEYSLTLPFGDLTAFLIRPDGTVYESPVFMIEQEGLYQDRMSRIDDFTGLEGTRVIGNMVDRAAMSFERLPPLSRLIDKGSFRVLA